MTTLSDYTVEEEGARGSPTNNGYQLPTKRHDNSDSSNKQPPTSTSPSPNSSSGKKQKHLETRDRDPYKDPPELERELTLDELKSRLDDVLRYRRILKFSLWTIVIGIIIYGAFNVTSFVEQHGINWPLSLLLPLIIDTGLCISLWSDRLLYEYMMKDRWVSGLRWTTGLITWGLNIGGSIIVDPDGGGPAVPQMLPDWVGIIVHSVGPVFLIVVSETTASMTRRVSSILRLISEKKNEQLTVEQEHQDAYDALSRELEETKRAYEDTLYKEQSLTDQLELSEQKSEQRLAETERIASIYTGTLPNHLPLGSGIGQSIVSSFLERFNQEGVFSLTSSDPQTGYSAVDTLSPRCYIVKASDDELFLIDTRNPRVERILESSKGNIHYSDIPSDLFIIMRNSDIEKEAYNLILKNDFDGDRSEFSSMVRCYGAGTMEGISNETVLRLVIRAGISTGKLKQSYNTGHQAG